jgi:hypothetical protein
MFGGGGAGLGSMLGPMIGGAAGSMFQPGSKSKDQATQVLQERNMGWDAWLASFNQSRQMQQMVPPPQTSDLVGGIITGLGTPQ